MTPPNYMKVFTEFFLGFDDRFALQYMLLSNLSGTYIGNRVIKSTSTHSLDLFCFTGTMKYIYCSLYQSKNLIFTQNSKYYRDQCHASIHKLKHTDITCIDRSIHSFLGFYFSPNFCTRTAKIYKDKWTRLHVSIILAKGKKENDYRELCL